MGILPVPGEKVHGLAPPAPLLELVEHDPKPLGPTVQVHPAAALSNAVQEHLEEVQHLIGIASERGFLVQGPIQPSPLELPLGQCPAHRLEVDLIVTGLGCAQSGQAAKDVG